MELGKVMYVLSRQRVERYLEGEGRLRIRIRIEAGRREMKLLSHGQFVSHVLYMTVQVQSSISQRQR